MSGHEESIILDGPDPNADFHCWMTGPGAGRSARPAAFRPTPRPAGCGAPRMRGGHLTLPPYNASRPRDGTQDVKDALVGCTLHQHKFHFADVYGLRRDQAGGIFLENDGLVFHEREEFAIEFNSSFLPLY
jgi:hypothetical protein